VTATKWPRSGATDGAVGGRLWSRWAPLVATATRWVPLARRVLVVAPHPDDEVLTVGGLLAELSGAGADVEVLAVTDGEAAYEGIIDPNRLAAVRRDEQRQALNRLAGPEVGLRRLGLPDGGVAGEEALLREAIAGEVSRFDLVVAPWIHDHHPDHEACGRAARAACRASSTALVHNLFWAWHHAEQDSLELRPLLRLEVTAATRRRKGDAIACHRTQLDVAIGPPVLGLDELEPALWPCEVYVAEGVR
jgi:LmbE family N-acetylglucosaminyl deacetylase